MFANADQGRDKKFEGYSNLKGAHEQQQKRIQKGAQSEMAKGLEEEYILNLQRQTVLLEQEIKLLKDREVDQKNKASGFETLLRDGIPLNEHFLALKNKFNNERDFLSKSIEVMEEEIQMEENKNKQRNHKIDILRREFDELSVKQKNLKEMQASKLKEFEMKLYTEQHTKDILTVEKQGWYDKVSTLKGVNQNMGRAITKDKYHNNREEVDRDRRKQIEETRNEISLLCEQVEVEQAHLESEQERNLDPHLLKRQKETTMNLKQDHNKMVTDITVAENRIKDLETRREILNASIFDILKDKRVVDKYNMELEEKIAGRNVTEEMVKKKHKHEERKMRIKLEKNLAYLKSMGVILMEKISNEEAKSKDVLDEKLKLEQELIDLKEDLTKLTEKQAHNREELIKQRVKNSQLDSQFRLLTEEEQTLAAENEKLTLDNEQLEKENLQLKQKIQETIERIDINNLLKEIDIEELQLLARNNKSMNFAMENLITKWNFITGKREMEGQ